MTDKVIDLKPHLQSRQQHFLKRIEQSLPAGNPIEKIHTILDRPDAREFVQSLHGQTLFRLIKEADWETGLELVPYASTEQIQTFVDLDCWSGTHLSVKKMEPWIAAILEDTPDAQFKQILRELDPEVIALFFKNNIQVELVEDDEIPPHLTGDVRLSPDNAYAIVYPEDEVTAALMHALIQRIYFVDFGLAWTLLEAARWELHSEMEEVAYHWRKSRLEEFGFVTPDEAMQIYRYINPVKLRERIENNQLDPKFRVHAPGDLDLPSVIQSQVNDDFFFFSALQEVTDDRLVGDLLFELATLTNWAMIADGIEPGEIESGKEVARRTLGFLSLGLEFLSRKELSTATELLTLVAQKQIFQAGYSLTRKLHLKVTALQTRPTLSMVEGEPFSLLSPDEEALCESLLRTRPTFSSDQVTFDIFRKQEQIDSAALRIGMIAFKQLWLFGVQRQTPEELAALLYGETLLNEPVDVTFDSLFATAVATTLLTGTPSIRGLTVDELEQLAKVLSQAPWKDDLVGYFEPLIGAIMVALPNTATHLATRWLSDRLNVLCDELASLHHIDAPEILNGIVLIARS